MTTLRTLLCLFDFFRAGRRQPGFALGVFLAMTAMLAAAPLNFEIAAQPASSALPLFITQSGAQVMYGHEEVAKVSTNAVTGAYEPKAALALLFKSTGLNFSERGESVFVVKNASVAEASRGTVRGTVVKPELGSSAGTRLLVRESGQQTVTDRRGDFVLANVEAGTYTLIASAEGLQTMHITDVTVRAGRELTLSRETMRKASDVTELEPFVVRGRADEVTELDKYIVEGQRQKPFTAGNMDIPRTINDAQPYYIFDAKTLDSSGAVNVEDFLKQRLTMNTTAMNNGQTSGLNLLGNTSTINLRGVGTDKTLILVNGRRMPGVYTDAGSYQPDLNGIPLSAIDRIEVLPSSASGIYGGSAIGGVVNVILKKDYQGGEIRATYDSPWGTDSPRRTISLNYGLALEGGKTQLSFNAAWSDAKPLLLQDRVEIYKANLADIQSRAPNFVYSSTSPWLGSLPNITPSSAAVTTLTLRPEYGGTVLGSRNTYIPAGTSGVTSATKLAAGLLVNAGQWNMDFPASPQSPTGLLRALDSTTETRSFSAGFHRQMLPTIELFADFSYSENRTDSVYNAASSSVVVPVDAPNNPFTTAVRVTVPDATQIPMTTNSRSRSVTVGALAQLPWGWTGALDYTWSENRFAFQYYYADGTARTADLLSGALNPFVDAMRYPLDFGKYHTAIDYAGASRLHSASLRGSGSLPALPWGTPTLTVGLERRVGQTPDRIYQEEYPITVSENALSIYYAKEAITDSAYAEATVPLVKSDWLPGVHALDFQVSGRSERYEVDTGTSNGLTYYNQAPPATYYGGPTLDGQPYFSKATYTSSNYTVGFKYQPVKEVTLRISQATAFLPPTPAQLVKNPQRSTSTTNVLDPVTGLITPVYTLSGGNPDLKPQSSKSLNAGVIWEPAWQPLRGLRLNAEYYKIEQFDAIGSLGTQAIVNQESLYPERVTRDSSGTITLVDNSSVNLYRRETEGWDLSADYSFKTGIGLFNLRAVESIILHLKNQYSQIQPEYDAVRFPSEGGAAKYKSNASLSWAWRGWTAGWTTRYFSSYRQYGALGGPQATQRAVTGLAPSTTYTLRQGGDMIPSQTYHDLLVGYAFGEHPSKSGSHPKALGCRLLDGLSVQVNVRNVFDKVAPIDAYYSSSYYLSPYGGGLAGMRSYVITVKKTF